MFRSGPSTPRLTLDYVREEKGDEFFSFHADPLTYLVRVDGGAPRRVTLDWNASLLADLTAVSASPTSPLAAQRLGQRLRALVAGTPFEAWEAALASRKTGDDLTTPTVELRSAAAELFALPWELLSLAPSGLPLAGLAEVRRAWPGVAPAPERDGSDRVLFAWSAAGGAVPWQGHRDALAGEGPVRVGAADVLPHASLASLVGALQQAIAEDRPFCALHLLCHGQVSGAGGSLLLDGERPVDAAALRDALQPFADSLRLVVLCACQAGDLGPLGNPVGGAALALHRVGFEAVLAPARPLGIPGSVRFAAAFYGALLGELRPVEEALAAARRVLAALPDPDWASMQLYRAAGDLPLRPFVLRPYRGLLGFDATNRSFYFGREGELKRLLGRVEAAARGELAGFQVLCGASGIGKTSLVRAGLVPALARTGRWQVRLVRPAGLMADDELGGPRGTHRLVVVDPLQELFTAIPLARRGRILQDLWQVAHEPGVVVLCLLRTDALPSCEALHVTPERRLDAVCYDERHRMFLATPSPTQLRVAIEAPAVLAGLRLEPGLADALLDEAGDEPGALPLLQHALDQIWQRRRGRLLTREALLELGGLAGAMATTADAAMERLDHEAFPIARRILTSLVGVGTSAEPGGRRRLLLHELRPATQTEAFDRVLEVLIEERLVVCTVGGGQQGVELAHESLLRRWTRLLRWVEEDREQLLRLHELRRWASEWLAAAGQSDGGESYLLRGPRLGYATEIVSRGLNATPAVLRLLQASREAEARDAEARQAALAERERMATEALLRADQAWDAAIRAQASARRERDPTLSLLLLREVRQPVQPLRWVAEVYRTFEDPFCAQIRPWPGDRVDLRGARGADGYTAPAGVELRGLPDGRADELIDRLPEPVSTLCWAPDGAALYLGTPRGQVLCRRAGRIEPLARLEAAVRALQVSADGARLCVACADGLVWLLDTDGRTLARYGGHIGEARLAVFSPDGAFLATAGEDRSVREIRLATGAVEVMRGFGDQVSDLRYETRGQMLLATCLDGSARFKSSSGLNPEGRAFGAPLTAAAFRPGARAVLLGDRSGQLHLWDLRSASVTSWQGHQGPVWSVLWPADGGIVSLGEDRALRRWRLPGQGEGQGELPMILGAHTAKVNVVAVDPGAARVASGDADGGVGLWSLAGATGADLPLTHREPVRCLCFDPSGVRLVTGASDDLAVVWDVSTGRPLHVLRGHELGVRAARFSPDGRWIATGSTDGRALLWDAATGRRVDGFEAAHDGELNRVEFACGDLLVTGSADGTARAWALAGGPSRVIAGAPDLVGEAVERQALSPDGARLAVVLASGAVRVVDVRRGSAIEVGAVNPPARALAWSGDGRRIAAGGDNGAILVLGVDVASRLRLPRLDGVINGLLWHPRGAILAALAVDGRAWLLETDGQGDPVRLGPCRAKILDLVFDPTGDWLVAGCDDGRVRRWPLSTPAVRAVLAAATRCELSTEQRARYLG